MEKNWKFEIGDIVYKGDSLIPLVIYKRACFNDNDESYYLIDEISQTYSNVSYSVLKLAKQPNKTMAKKAFTHRVITFSSGRTLRLIQSNSNKESINLVFESMTQTGTVVSYDVHTLTIDDCLELTRQLDSYIEEVEENNEANELDKQINNEEFNSK